MTRRRTDPTILDLMFPGPYLASRINELETHMSEAEDRLNEAIARVGTDLGDAISRVEAKLADAGIDVEDEIGDLNAISDRLVGLAADPVEPPVDEPPVDPPVEP